MWPLLSGANQTSPRTSILFTEDLIIHGEWKYVRGGAKMVEAAWGGAVYPNASTASDPIDSHQEVCPEQGCLYNVVRDRSEHHEVSAKHPELVAKLAQELDLQAATIWSVKHEIDPQCRVFAVAHWGGFLGPWREVNNRLA
jgi:hypothetical protein